MKKVRSSEFGVRSSNHPLPQSSPLRGEEVRKVPSPLWGEGRGEGKRFAFHVSRLTAFLLLTAYSLLPTAVLAQETQTVTSEGIAPIVEGNTAIARDNALNDALRKAVEQAVGTMISSDTVTQNYQLLSDRIYSRSQGYVQSYKILSEGAADEVYRVNVQAAVALSGLEDDLSSLGLLIKRKGMPRVLFMIAEQNIGRQYYVFWWSYWGEKKEFMARQGEMGVTEQVLAEKFLGKGFNIVDYGVRAKDIKLGPSFGVVDLADGTVKTIGGRLDAEVVIYGKAVAKSTGRVMGTGIHSSQAEVNARAVRVDTGEVIASASASGSAVYSEEMAAGSKALEKAGTVLAEKLVDQISKKWGQEVLGGALVQVVVSGIDNYSDFVKFKNAVQNMVRGVQAVYQRSLSSGVATVDVEIKGDAQSLADGITLIDFKDFDVGIVGVSGDRVELTILPKKQR